MNPRSIGRLVVAAAFAAAIVVSDPGGAGNVAPVAVADRAAQAGANAIIITDPPGNGQGPK